MKNKIILTLTLFLLFSNAYPLTVMNLPSGSSDIGSSAFTLNFILNKGESIPDFKCEFYFMSDTKHGGNLQTTVKINGDFFKKDLKTYTPLEHSVQIIYSDKTASKNDNTLVSMGIGGWYTPDMNTTDHPISAICRLGTDW